MKAVLAALVAVILGLCLLLVRANEEHTTTAKITNVEATGCETTTTSTPITTTTIPVTTSTRATTSTTTAVTTTTVKTTTTTLPLGVCPTSDTSSTYTGTHYINSSGVTAVIDLEYKAGITNRDDLLALTGIGIAESSLWSQARNWHPDYGCRPRTDIIGVQGPNSVWDSTHIRQLNSDRGIYQISTHWWPQYTDAVTDTIGSAAVAAKHIHDVSTNGWSQWDTYKNGAAQKHYDTAYDGWPAIRPLVDAYLSSH